MLIAGILGYSIGVWFDMLTMLQMIHLFPVARLYMPTSLFKFFKALELLNFQGINYSIWNFEDVISSNDLVENGDATSYNFKKMGFNSSSFLITSQDVIICIIYMSFIPIIVRSIALIFDKSILIKNFENKVM